MDPFKTLIIGTPPSRTYTGSATGLLTAANNLSDVADAATAAENIGLGATDTAILTGVSAPDAASLTLTGGTTGAQIELEPSTGNIILTPKSDGSSGADFVQVDASFTGTQTANVYGIRAQYTLAHAGTNENITWANAGVLGEINIESTNAHPYSNRQHGLYAYVNHHGSGQVGLPIGVWGVLASRGAGGMGTGRAFDAHMFAENIDGTGGVTSFTGFHCRSVTTDGATIGTVYGAYIEEQTGASTNWAVYTAGATPSYFGGDVTIAGSIIACTAANENLYLGADARATNVGIQINAAAEKNKYVGFYTGGVLRWFLASDLTAESGANAGSDWKLQAYDDAGSIIGNAISIARATMAVTLGGALTITGNTTLAGGLVSYGANDSGGAGYRLVRVPNT